ncbi:GNAT family acetyltransferase [Bacillus glycinifermentans]|uniref:GNAT family N-acetyltransferase n=1 Tax=Bacillus glycinifermentans TaxID=1664069 RepID=A0A0J6HQJ9_9BACI|nr:GNAT family N-acetyltransferase [Bacillus glycinifermentans]ATH93126.1 N-acetyltransferase [Bacillus glycinifermentans]KMM56195.1 GNAT family acetyltransferase [Bacillus glycinifermentans]KRT94370.1 GNAT family acetyltransferase [Bacillus glycinifermentans]MEC0485903.1 GNAT family N-acetyltransferase [Bacillus glycinifermentans]MEC0496716.1 GNAT family N-acetyltransferase [Bacillus glycinifermentans]
MEFQVRPMEKKDIPQVQHVAKTSWHHTYEGIIPGGVQEKFLASAYNDHRMEERLERSFLYVSEAEGNIVGFANFSGVNEKKEAYLAAIYLYPEYQGKGIGTALLHEGIKRLKDAGKIFVDVEKDNQIGITFYKAKGFEVVSEYDEDFEGHILRNVRMVLHV